MDADKLDLRKFKRVVVIGSCCAGKSTFAVKLAGLLRAERIELDALHWLPEWKERADDEFRQLICDAAAARRWVTDGNYLRMRDLSWDRATAIIWLDYSFPVVFYRTVKRTLRRVLRKEELYSGNRETFRSALFSRDSMIYRVFFKYVERRREIAEIIRMESDLYAFVVIRNPSELTRLLEFVRRNV